MLDTDLSLCGHRTCTQQWTCFLSVSCTEKHWTWSFTSWKSEKLLAVYHQDSHSYTLFCRVISLWDYLGYSVVSIPSYHSWLHTHRASGNQRRKRPLVKVYSDFGDGCLFKGLLLKSSPPPVTVPIVGVFWILVSSGTRLVGSVCHLTLRLTCQKLCSNKCLENLVFPFGNLAAHPVCKVWSDNEIYWMLFCNLDQETLKFSETSAGGGNLVSILLMRSEKRCFLLHCCVLFLGADPIWWIDLQYP